MLALTQPRAAITGRGWLLSCNAGLRRALHREVRVLSLLSLGDNDSASVLYDSGILGGFIC